MISLILEIGLNALPSIDFIGKKLESLVGTLPLLTK